MYNLHLKKRIQSNENNNHRSKNAHEIVTESKDSFSTFPAKTVENESTISNLIKTCDDNLYEDPRADTRCNEIDENEYEDPRTDARSE